MTDYDLGLLDDDDYKVKVLSTKLLGIAEVFMYRLPSKSKTPFKAEDWPLTKPLQCVSLRIERRGNQLLLIFTYSQDDRPGSKSKLFALCTIDIVSKDKPMSHYVEDVVDSTRYFVIRVTDEKAGREAQIGLGFREREEASDFRTALAKYEADIGKERAERALQMANQ
eukprot:CAMPEP_0119550666 /NCGR_PEP_ID=MMETSP1352-20130426/4142_1 /TAXON_ID=265584 /ORGANISM="Stauroneis constricta, Strain CCMP1120" /LENGTH=167 /DNA_ID=CAMNT_0007596587 /DNA_START=113 /DNA_END=616 /DNA_ORIENTATION=+